MPKPRRLKTASSDAWSYLLRLLRYRPRTVAEARRRMRERGLSEADVDAAVDRALNEGLLDDPAFVKLWIEDRLLHRPLARAAVRRELLDLGADATLVADQLDRLYPEARELPVALALARKRLARVQSVERDRRIARVVAFLVRRGFARGAAVRAARAAEEEETSDDTP